MRPIKRTMDGTAGVKISSEDFANAMEIILNCCVRSRDPLETLAGIIKILMSGIKKSTKRADLIERTRR